MGYHKGKLGKRRHKQEDDERIGERYQKRRNGVVHERPCAVLVALPYVGGGIAAPAIHAKHQEHHAAYDLQPELIGGIGDEIHDETHAKTSYQGVNDITDRGAHASDKAVPTAFFQRALYAQYTHRPHWCGGYDPNEKSLQD